MMRDIVFDGYRPGVLGEIVCWHGRYYSANWGFGLHFEANVTAGLAEFAQRLEEPRNLLLTAWSDKDFLGSVVVDTDGVADASVAHLRWFILADGSRGRGIGRRMLARAIEFAQENKFEGMYLTTFRGLDAAAKLYTDHSFQLTEEAEGGTWGMPMTEQRYELRL